MTTSSTATGSLNFDQVKAAHEEQKSAAEVAELNKDTDEVFKVGTRRFTPRRKIPLKDTIESDLALRSDDPQRIVESFALFVVKPEREGFLEYILEDPESDDDVVALDDLMGELRRVQELIAARPTDR